MFYKDDRVSQHISHNTFMRPFPTYPENGVGLTLDAVVVEMQVLQVTIEERNRGELVVGQLQVQQGGNVEHIFGNSFIAQLVVVQPHKCQVSEAFEVVSE